MYRDVDLEAFLKDVENVFFAKEDNLKKLLDIKSMMQSFVNALRTRLSIEAGK